MSGAATGPDRTRPPAPRPLRPFRFPAFQRLELDDGLVLFLASSRGRPLVFLEVNVPAGARFSPDGRAGLAALTGAMLDEGTPGKTSSEIAAAAELLGGYLSTSTDWDRTAIATAIISPHAGAAIELLGEVLREPTLPRGELARQRDRVLAEIRRRRPMAQVLAARQFARALYGTTVFGYPLLGTTASVEAIERADVQAFYERRVVAAPIALIAAGDLELERLGDLVRSALAGLPRRPGEALPTTTPAEPRGTRVFLVDRPDSAQTELRVGHVGIGRGHPDFVPVTVMNSLLGGKFTSRLTLNLRERHGFTYSVTSSFSRRRDAGPFLVSSAVATESVGRAVAEIRGELERLRAEPVATGELEETRSYILGVFPYTVQTLEGVAHRLREIAVHELPLDYWHRYPEAVRSVTADDVLRVAREHLRPEHLSIVAVGPADALRPQLEPFGEPIVWHPADEPEPPAQGPSDSSRRKG